MGGGEPYEGLTIPGPAGESADVDEVYDVLGDCS